MIHALLALYERNLDIARRMVADIPDTRIADQPRPDMNHPAWVLGHLGYVAHVVVCGRVLKIEPDFPRDLGPRVDHKSTPAADASTYPDKAALLSLLADGHRRVHEHVQAQGDPILAQPVEHEGLAQRFPTVGHALVHMMIGHEQFHLGQLSAWRRTCGMPRV